jgi:protein-L-isoaspartate(D-aspartate) O-methyltransferase
MSAGDAVTQDMRIIAIKKVTFFIIAPPQHYKMIDMRRLPAVLMLVLTAASCSLGSEQKEPTDPYQAARERMVSYHLAARGITDERVLQAMLKVPRHELVPEEVKNYAYADHPLPIGEDQTISQPYIVAFMTMHLQLDGDERVLEIGTGSGYQAAVLAELCDEIFSIEIIPGLARRAKRDLERLGYKNIHLREGDGYRGWPEEAPFDAIIVTAAPDHIPQPLVDQLKIGGRMVLPLGGYFQQLVLITREEEGVRHTPLSGVRFVPMTGEAQGAREE